MDRIPVTPRFTVVVPARDEETTLPATLRSIADQDFAGGVEVIVVDNASTDRTAAVAAGFGVTVLVEGAPGVCGARQCGTANAVGEIVVSTDADTVHPRTWLSTIDATFRADPLCVAVAGPCRYTGGPRWVVWYPAVLFGAVAGVARVTGRVGYATATNLAFRRAVWSGYDTRLTQGGDELDVIRRLRRVGRITFRSDNPVLTSPRRFDRGLLHALFVTLGYQYLLGYLLNRALGRPLVGTAPAAGLPVPKHGGRRSGHWAVLTATTAVILLVAVVVPGAADLLQDAVTGGVTVLASWARW